MFPPCFPGVALSCMLYFVGMKNKIATGITSIKRHWKIALIITLVIVGVGGYFYQKNKPTQENFTFVHPIRQEIVETVELSGTVDAKQRAHLRFAMGGKITYLGAQEGDAVKKWQTIATIDQATLQKQLQQNLNMYMKQRWDWDQTQSDIENNYAGLSETERRTVDKEQFDLNNSVLSVEIQDIAIQNTRLTAPFDGILTKSPVSVPGVTLLGSDYFELINPATVIFRAYVDEDDVVKIKQGQTAQIELDAFRNETTQSSVSYISYTSVQGRDGTVFIVEFPLTSDAMNMPFRIGMNGDAIVTVNQKSDVLTIPLIATIFRDDATYVKVKNEAGEIEERIIETGLESEELIEVVSGLSENDVVLLPE